MMKCVKISFDNPGIYLIKYMKKLLPVIAQNIMHARQVDDAANQISQAKHSANLRLIGIVHLYYLVSIDAV